jgi:hypothetical protein
MEQYFLLPILFLNGLPQFAQISNFGFILARPLSFFLLLATAAQDREQKTSPDLDFLNWLNGRETILLQLVFPQGFSILFFLALL